MYNLNHTGKLIVEQLAPFISDIRIVNHIDSTARNSEHTPNTPSADTTPADRVSQTETQPTFHAIGDIRIEELFTVDVALNPEKMDSFRDSSALKHPAVAALLPEGTARTSIAEINPETGKMEFIPEAEQKTIPIPSAELLATAISHLFPMETLRHDGDDFSHFQVRAHAVATDFNTGKPYDGLGRSNMIVDALQEKIQQQTQQRSP